MQGLYWSFNYLNLRFFHCLLEGKIVWLYKFMVMYFNGNFLKIPIMQTNMSKLTDTRELIVIADL